MPEGHTLHRLAGDLQETFAGRAVRVSSPQGRFAEAAALLDGEVLTGAEAWGKHLFVAFPSDRHVHVHLGLYGVFAVHPAVDEGVSLGSRPSRASSGGVPRKAEEGGDAPASTTDDNAARCPQDDVQQAMEPRDSAVDGLPVRSHCVSRSASVRARAGVAAAVATAATAPATAVVAVGVGAPRGGGRRQGGDETGTSHGGVLSETDPETGPRGEPRGGSPGDAGLAARREELCPRLVR